MPVAMPGDDSTQHDDQPLHQHPGVIHRHNVSTHPQLVTDRSADALTRQLRDAIRVIFRKRDVEFQVLELVQE